MRRMILMFSLVLLTAPFSLVEAQSESERAEVLCKEVMQMCIDRAKKTGEREGFLLALDA